MVISMISVVISVISVVISVIPVISVNRLTHFFLKFHYSFGCVTHRSLTLLFFYSFLASSYDSVIVGGPGLLMRGLLEGGRAPAAQRQMSQMRKKISFGPTFFHLAQTFGAYFFRRHFYFFLCYKRYELRKRLMTPNKQCRWRVFLNWW